MADTYLPRFLPGRSITFVPESPVVAGRFVKLGAGDKAIVMAGANDYSIGVAATDGETNQETTVWTLTGTVHRVEAAADIKTGDLLSVAADGKAAPAGAVDPIIVGRAIENATAGTPAVFIGIGA